MIAIFDSMYLMFLVIPIREWVNLSETGEGGVLKFRGVSEEKRVSRF